MWSLVLISGARTPSALGGGTFCPCWCDAGCPHCLYPGWQSWRLCEPGTGKWTPTSGTARKNGESGWGFDPLTGQDPKAGRVASIAGICGSARWRRTISCCCQKKTWKRPYNSGTTVIELGRTPSKVMRCFGRRWKGRKKLRKGMTSACLT